MEMKNNTYLGKKINNPIGQNNINDKNKNPKNILIQTYNNLKKPKNEEENANDKEDINKTNYNDYEMQIKNKNILNCYTKKSNIIPLTRENSITYIRKKSLNMNVYNNVENNFASNTPSALKNKKNINKPKAIRTIIFNIPSLKRQYKSPSNINFLSKYSRIFR